MGEKSSQGRRAIIYSVCVREWEREETTGEEWNDVVCSWVHWASRKLGCFIFYHLPGLTFSHLRFPPVCYFEEKVLKHIHIPELATSTTLVCFLKTTAGSESVTQQLFPSRPHYWISAVSDLSAQKCQRQEAFTNGPSYLLGPESADHRNIIRTGYWTPKGACSFQ